MSLEPPSVPVLLRRAVPASTPFLSLRAYGRGAFGRRAREGRVPCVRRRSAAAGWLSPPGPRSCPRGRRGSRGIVPVPAMGRGDGVMIGVGRVTYPQAVGGSRCEGKGSLTQRAEGRPGSRPWSPYTLGLLVTPRACELGVRGHSLSAPPPSFHTHTRTLTVTHKPPALPTYRTPRASSRPVPVAGPR